MPNISRSKGNQAVKFGQLIKYNLRNIFLKNSYPKCGGEIFLDVFLKIQNRSYLRVNSLISFIQFVFIICQVQGYQNILKLRGSSLDFTSNKALFLKKKGVWD